MLTLCIPISKALKSKKHNAYLLTEIDMCQWSTQIEVRNIEQ